MRKRHTLLIMLPLIMAAACLTAGLRTVLAQEETGKTEKKWTAPVLMEVATVRGKVVVLETRRDDRKVVEDLSVEVWTAPEDAQEEKKRLVETKTDSNGFFTLPVLKVGDYRLLVGELTLNLTVIPKADDRKGQAEEPKILLILLPKEVV